MAEETSGSIGTARIDVTVNTETMQPGIAAAKRAVSGMGDQASKEFDKANASNQRYAASLIRQAELLGKSRAEQIAYNAQTRIGGELGEKIAAKALANEAKLSAAMGNTAKSAKELQFAMRQVPAQITDIVTGLASGQRPMMVLLQQGGQLKDVFGGIKPAAAALGRSLLGLINPLTVSAAAAAALLVAWKQGSDEAVAYNKALITTGNYAGLTAESLGQMAKAIGETAGTQHQAAAALAEVAGSGKFTAEQIGLVGRAAVAMSELTGQATSETIKQFEDLGKKPVEAILKLNDSQHFLTAAIYEQIKALEDQGRTQDAAQLAMNTYADTVEKRRADVVENLGLIEQSWRGIRDAALKAGDVALNVGRQMSDQQKFDVLVENRNAAKDLIDRGMGGSSFYGTTAEKFYKDATDKLLAMQDERIAKEKEQARKAAEQRILQDRTDSDREAAAYFTNAQKRAQEYLKAENEFNERIARAMKAGDSKLAERERQQKASVLAGINAKYADKSRPGVMDSSIGNDPRADLTASIGKEIEGYKAVFDQQSKNTVGLMQYTAAMDARIKTEREAAQLQVESIGLGQHQIEIRSKIIDIERESNRDLEKLNREFADKSFHMTQDDYDARLKVIKAKEAERVQIVMETDRQIAAARGDASLGAQAAIADFQYAADDVAGQTYSVWSNSLQGMTDELADFFTTGKANWKDFAQDVLRQIAKIQIAKAVAGIASSFAGNTNTISGYDSATPQQQVAYDVAHGYANGGVFANSPSLSAYSGGIYDKPHLFAFARGAGVFGEAGPEAIMPLRRGPDGKLGVAAAGAGGGDVQVEVNITNNGQAVQAQQTGTRRDGQKVIVDMVLDAVASDIATGGRTSKAMQQRYGLQRRGVPVGG